MRGIAILFDGNVNIDRKAQHIFLVPLSLLSPSLSTMDEHQPKPPASPSALVYDEVVVGRVTRASLLMEPSTASSTRLATRPMQGWPKLSPPSPFSFTSRRNSRSCLSRVQGLMGRASTLIGHQFAMPLIHIWLRARCFVTQFDPNVAVKFLLSLTRRLWFVAHFDLEVGITFFLRIFFVIGIVWMKIER